MSDDPLSPLLDDRPLAGAVVVERSLGPARIAAVVPPYHDPVDVVRSRCEYWGGGAHLLLPASTSDGALEAPWNTFLQTADCDWIEILGGERRSHRDRSQVAFPPPVVLALHALDRTRESLRTVTLPLLDSNDPWLISYLATFGDLPNAPSEDQIARFHISQAFSYDDIIPTTRVELEGSSSDLLARLRDSEILTPVELSLVTLGTKPAIKRQIAPPLFPREAGPAIRVGNDIVVVYEPGSLNDLCLLWCLRAAHGFPSGLPLAVPNTEDVVAVVSEWDRQDMSAFGGNFPLPDGRALTSASVPEDDLRALAETLGTTWRVAPVGDLLRCAPPASRHSSDLVQFGDGRARVAAWSEEDRRILQRSAGHLFDSTFRVRLRPQEQELPPLPSLEVHQILTNGDYRSGAFETRYAGADKLVRMTWPTGWTVVEAFARDRGLTVRPSQAGKASTALVTRMGGLRQLGPLSSPVVSALLYRLCERRGMTWFKERLNQLQQSLAAGDAAEASELVATFIANVAASPDDADRRSITLQDEYARALGTRSEIVSWFAWAEDSGVLVRGVTVECDHCGLKTWRSTAELALPIGCPGCGDKIRRPFRPDVLTFRYRASETLLAVVENDALGHLLTLNWMSSLFHVGFGDAEDLFGGHPGVDFVDAGGNLIGEADVFLLFSDGTTAIGEYKLRGNGLNEAELAKLDRLANAIGADWTFVATHDYARACPHIWRECQRSLPDRPRFALTAERLYDHPIRQLGANPFEWPDDEGEDDASGSIYAPGSQAEWLADLADPDSVLKRAWEYYDKKLD